MEKQTYLGLKRIGAVAMTLGAYNALRGWTIPENEDTNKEGYLVEYLDSKDAPNHPDFEHYISWSPKDTFEAAYKPVDGLPFGHAIEALKLGKRVARTGWNGKGMFLHLIQPSEWTFTDGKNDNFTLLPFVAMKTAQDQTVPWLASQTDVLATDWVVLD